MKLRNMIQAVTLSGAALFMMVANVSATTITYTDAVAGTGFGVNGADGLVLNSTNGLATLTFATNGEILGAPTNANYGVFTLACPTCSTQAAGTISALFNNFTFSIKISDTTDGATGIFVGTASGGTIFSDSSPLNINWAPSIIGPGTTNAASGNFGPTSFDINAISRIVCPTCGNSAGQTTVQGSVISSAVPEPATLSLVGGALLGVGLLRRRKTLSRS